MNSYIKTKDAYGIFLVYKEMISTHFMLVSFYACLTFTAISPLRPSSKSNDTVSFSLT